MSKTMDRRWQMPQPFCATSETLGRMYPLMVYNTLTKTKCRFIPMSSKNLTWYQCGPTVYDVSHVGHARTYVSLDIIRRIMRKYLGYNIILCQNVTDIDDKIINRSSEKNIDYKVLSKQFETEFLEDMKSLNVQLPDIMTRVSEYVTEIILYIQVLANKNFAYELNGSVYFDIEAFKRAGFKYGKIAPEFVDNVSLLAEGEGSLLVETDAKRSKADFVLWKKTKGIDKDGNRIDEPSWESPWGPGRPGWHIECSAMSASAMSHFNCGRIDVHAGGVDLKFPHHENEVAQSEAYLGSHQWVNYWLHTGHVEIKGLKMSKSLKNFITIRQALEVYTSRQIRFCFLLHKYNEPMEYGDNSMNHAAHIEKIFSEYFHNVKAVLRRLGTHHRQHLSEDELKLTQAFEEIKVHFDEALMDDFDTPRAISYLLDLVNKMNRYIDSNNVSSILLSTVSKYLTEIFDLFGLIPASADVGFPLESNSVNGVVSHVSSEQSLTPYLDVLTKFRETVRVAAINNDMNAVLEAADQLRDTVLPELGVRMEDKGTGKDVTTIWKLDDPTVLRKEKAQREELKAVKEAQRIEAALKKKLKEEKAKIPPCEMFLSHTDLYSAFDETGIPTKDAKGENISKNAMKKILKEYEQQAKIYDEFMKKSSDEHITNESSTT